MAQPDYRHTTTNMTFSFIHTESAHGFPIPFENKAAEGLAARHPKENPVEGLAAQGAQNAALGLQGPAGAPWQLDFRFWPTPWNGRAVR